MTPFWFAKLISYLHISVKYLLNIGESGFVPPFLSHPDELQAHELGDFFGGFNHDPSHFTRPAFYAHS